MIKVGAAIVLLTVIGAIVAPWAVPYDPARQELALRLERPSLQHPFGLDELGRDIFSRVLAGARISLFVGLTVVGISSVVGVLLGSIAGYFGGWLDDVISRTIDVLLAFPGILLAIALVAVLGPSLSERRDGVVGDRLGWLRPPRPRAGAQGARTRVRAGRARAWRGHVPHPASSRGADDDAGGDGAGDARDGRRHSCGGLAELSRPRRAAADAKLGDDAQRRPAAPARCART